MIGRVSPSLNTGIMSDANDEGKGFPANSAGKAASNAPPKKKAVQRKKAKKPKDMPKRPLSAYNIFFQQERTKLMEARERGEMPDDFEMNSVSSNEEEVQPGEKRKRASLFQAIAQTIANRWKSLPNQERAKFEDLAKEEMKKYRIKKDEYQQRMVRETLDNSNGRGSESASSPAMAPSANAAAGNPAAAAGMSQAAILGRHGLFPGQAIGAAGTLPGGLHGLSGAAMGMYGMPPHLSGGALSIQDLLQRQAFAGAGGDRFGLGMQSQDFALQQAMLQGGGGMDRLLALRALQNEQSMQRLDPMSYQHEIPSYMNVSSSLDPRLAESFRMQEGFGGAPGTRASGAGTGASGAGGAGIGAAGAPSDMNNMDLLGRMPPSQLQLSDLPPEQLLRYLRQGGGGPPPGGFQGYGGQGY